MKQTTFEALVELIGEIDPLSPDPYAGQTPAISSLGAEIRQIKMQLYKLIKILIEEGVINGR